MATLHDLRAVKSTLRGQLLQLGLGGGVVAMRATLSVNSAVERAGRSVHAIGIGRKVTADRGSSEMCVRVYVVQKLPASLLSPRDVIPATIDGVPTDIIESQPAFVLSKKKTIRQTAAKRRPHETRNAAMAIPTCTVNRRKRQRPVVGGISAGHRDITAGTIACFCRSTRVGDDPTSVYALSNNHVFANVNQALLGDPLYQPGPIDGGTLTDYFAKLDRYVHISLGGTEANRVDAAIGGLLPGVPYKAEVCSIGSISGTLQGAEDMPVRKHGRTTGYTEGKIDDVEYDALVGMDHSDPSIVALFNSQLRLVSTTSQPIGLGGDSGSAVFHKTQNRIVGLYFAGPSSGSYGVANRIQDVMNELQIDIL